MGHSGHSHRLPPPMVGSVLDPEGFSYLIHLKNGESFTLPEPKRTPPTPGRRCAYCGNAWTKTRCECCGSRESIGSGLIYKRVGAKENR